MTDVRLTQHPTTCDDTLHNIFTAAAWRTARRTHGCTLQESADVINLQALASSSYDAQTPEEHLSVSSINSHLFFFFFNVQPQLNTGLQLEQQLQRSRRPKAIFSC